MYYIATKWGFVERIVQDSYTVTRNVRLAQPFTSWIEADNTAKEIGLGYEYYAILKA